jgi:hypothetical protein
MEYNSFEICEEILDHFDNPDWIGESDIDDYLDKYYEDMDDTDRWFVHDRMEKFVDYVDPYCSIEDSNVNDDWGEDEYEDED